MTMQQPDAQAGADAMNPFAKLNPMELTPLKTNPLAHLSSPSSARRAMPLLLAVCCAMLLAGCSKKDKALPPSAMGPGNGSDSLTTGIAPTATITADPLAIDLGSTVVLNWRTTNATVVTIDGIGPVAVNGTQTVSPSNSTNFHLVAKGDGGITEANVRVTVRVRQTLAPGGTTMGPAAGGGKVTDAEFTATVRDMFFDYDSFDLRADAAAQAAASAAFLVQHPDVRVLIGGYADERGSAEYNLALGENRANAAKTGLVTAGVAPARIRVISYGKEKQFCTESSEACWQENRRAQFTIDR
jgi:peptidoglycan-associated lipoprotein